MTGAAQSRAARSNYLDVADGGAGGVYDWTSGAWSAQVDFAFPTVPVFPGGGAPFLLVSKGSFAAGTGWEIQINDSALNGKYQIQLESNHGVGSYDIVAAYQIQPGSFSRALFVCDETGTGTWYVNGVPWSPQSCAPSSPGATDLLIGRYSGANDFAANFPISRVQVWNRALSVAEATLSTTTDPAFGTVQFNGTPTAPISWSPTSIVALVPPEATTGPVVVTVGGQSSNGMNFTVPDTTPPTVTGVTPDGRHDSGRDVVGGDGDVQRSDDGGQHQRDDGAADGPGYDDGGGDGELHRRNATATLTPSGASRQPDGVTATVKSGASGVKDAAGNPLASDSSGRSRRGSRHDGADGQRRTPLNAATERGLASTVTATFSEAMTAASISGTTVLLTGPGTTTVAATVSYSAATRAATLNADAPWRT